VSLLQYEIASEFQRRRQITGRLERPWIWLLIAGWIGVFAAFFSESLSPRTTAGLFFVSLVALASSTVRINFIMMKHYRCPSCDKIPIVNGMHNGVLINPSECPSCGVSLK
jgi:hypothetical protein